MTKSPDIEEVLADVLSEPKHPDPVLDVCTCVSCKERLANLELRVYNLEKRLQ